MKNAISIPNCISIPHFWERHRSFHSLSIPSVVSFLSFLSLLSLLSVFHSFPAFLQQFNNSIWSTLQIIPKRVHSCDAHLLALEFVRPFLGLIPMRITCSLFKNFDDRPATEDPLHVCSTLVAVMYTHTYTLCKIFYLLINLSLAL